MFESVVRKTTLAERCENGTLTLDDTVNTWGMGMCCLHCGLPVTIRIGHYNTVAACEVCEGTPCRCIQPPEGGWAG